MRKGRALELAPIIIAYGNGAIIQVKEEMSEKWQDSDEPEFIEHFHYRIKPNIKLIPFGFEDNLSFRDKWFKDKQNKQMLVKIYSINRRDGEILIGEEWVTYKQFLDEYIFEDGSPCGKYINE